ncbi:winged helix-turn-helix domain-containing protein [Amycolatopsis sp. NPDC049868]|uniref:winged helix-turn-helix domain-containing protein n=1 Tax=Amycolatopsis sp. NPDC049868 TaxID=3363934 RepID=UPI00378DF9F5
MHVLVVEDDENLRLAIGGSLRDAGISVDTVADLLGADLALAATTYDSVVFEQSLPSGDVLDYVRARRSNGWTVPVMVLTSRDANADRFVNLSQDVDDFLIKPFSMEELIARVRGLRLRSASSTPSVLRVGDLEINQERREVRRSGVLLKMTRTEFGVLERLAAQPGQPVSRTELVSHAWDELATLQDNALDVVVARLRRKLGRPMLVQTVRGFGYQLVNDRATGAATISENLTGELPAQRSVLPVPDRRGHVDTAVTFPVTIYLDDESAHRHVQAAVEELIFAADAEIVDRDDPQLGSWFRRMRARTRAAATSGLAREAAATAAHALDARLVLAQDASVTAMMMQNLGPVLASLETTKNAVIRVGALLIVKVEGTVAVHQLTAVQQLLLDHHPQLLTSPQDILTALRPITDSTAAAALTGPPVTTPDTMQNVQPPLLSHNSNHPDDLDPPKSPGQNDLANPPT